MTTRYEQRGAALVEFALVASLFFTVLIAVMDIGTSGITLWYV